MNWNKAIRILDDMLCIIAIIIMPLRLAEFICEPYIESRCEDDI